jgi:ABC-type bacteriocin/lantibiotic exporter with double-glycine peptidase domain
MVLHYWGVEKEQEELAQLFGVEPEVGVPAGRISRLKVFDMNVIYDEGEWEVVDDCLTKSIPVIAAIQAGELSYWQGELFQHAVVVVGHDESYVWILDPATKTQPIVVPIDEFMLAWGEMDYRYAILQPR